MLEQPETNAMYVFWWEVDVSPDYLLKTEFKYILKDWELLRFYLIPNTTFFPLFFKAFLIQVCFQSLPKVSLLSPNFMLVSPC